MIQWEYLTFTSAYSGSDGLGIVKMYNDKELDDWKQKKWAVASAMQELGAQGWELVHVLWRKTHEANYADPVYYFKRPKP